MIPSLLVVFTRQLEILVTALSEQLGPDMKSARAESESVDDLNTSIPNIHTQILQTDFYAFS